MTDVQQDSAVAVHTVQEHLPEGSRSFGLDPTRANWDRKNGSARTMPMSNLRWRAWRLKSPASTTSALLEVRTSGLCGIMRRTEQPGSAGIATGYTSVCQKTPANLWLAGDS